MAEISPNRSAKTMRSMDSYSAYRAEWGKTPPIHEESLYTEEYLIPSAKLFEFWEGFRPGDGLFQDRSRLTAAVAALTDTSFKVTLQLRKGIAVPELSCIRHWIYKINLDAIPSFDAASAVGGLYLYRCDPHSGDAYALTQSFDYLTFETFISQDGQIASHYDLDSDDSFDLPVIASYSLIDLLAEEKLDYSCPPALCQLLDIS